MPADLDADLRLARELGARAAEVALGWFRTGVESTAKDDGSPVTEADLAVEQALLDALGAERPADSVLSEERGLTRRAGRRRWLLDPIDGTVYFVADHPAWGTHVALDVDGEIVVGVITRPAEGSSWWASRGGGAWASTGDQLQVSDTATLRDAKVAGYVPPGSVWKDRVAKIARWVDTPSPILELIEGRVDAVLSEGGFEWDHAPAVVLLEEAGGRFTDPRGGRRIDLRGGLYTNGHLDDQLLALRP